MTQAIHRASLITRGLVPPVVVLVALPVSFVLIQLGSSMVFQWALPFARHMGAAPPLAQSYATLAAMVTGSGLLLLCAVAIPLLQSVGVREAFAVRGFSAQAAGWAALGTVALSPVADLLMGLMSEFFPDRTLGSVPMLHDLAQQLSPVLLWPVFALLPGVAEEAFFRGLLLNAFRKPVTAVLVSGLCFALFHVDPHHVAGVLPLGLFLSWVGYRHGVLVTMAAHVANNSIALLSVRFSEIDVGYGTETPMPIYWLPIGLALCAYAARQLVQLASAAEARGATN